MVDWCKLNSSTCHLGKMFPHRLGLLLLDLYGSIPSCSRIRLSALNRLSCFFLKELSISLLIGETFSN